MTMFQINTPGAYLVKDGVKKRTPERFVGADEIEGWAGPSHRVSVINRDTMVQTMYFPGQPIVTSTDTGKLSKKELRELMPDQKFPKKATREDLLEAYHATR